MDPINDQNNCQQHEPMRAAAYTHSNQAHALEGHKCLLIQKDLAKGRKVGVFPGILEDGGGR